MSTETPKERTSLTMGDLLGLKNLLPPMATERVGFLGILHGQLMFINQNNLAEYKAQFDTPQAPNQS